MTTTRKATAARELRARARRASKRCTHPDAYLIYPGEITIDKDGLMREDDMRLQCPDCNTVTTYDGP